MTVALLEAITTHLGTLSSALAVHDVAPGAYFFSRAPQGTACPYIVLTVPDDATNPRFSADNEKTVVDFAVFDDVASPKRALAILEVLKTAFADNLLGGVVYGAQRTGDALIEDEDDEVVIGFDAHTRIEYMHG